MADPLHLRFARSGAEAFSRWRSEFAKTIPDLHAGDFIGAHFAGMDFAKCLLGESRFMSANLTGADLSRADLRDCDFRGANLTRANLSGADLRNANLTKARLVDSDLTDANLEGAVLSGTEFRGTTLQRTNVSGSRIGWCTFAEVDLASLRGAGEVRHTGPNAVATSSLVASGGAASKSFLRGSGLSPWEVVLGRLYNPALQATEVREIVERDVYGKLETRPPFARGVYLLHADVDERFVEKLLEVLAHHGIPVWRVVYGSNNGEGVDKITRRLRHQDLAVLVLSEASVKLGPVAAELVWGRESERREGRNVLRTLAIDNLWRTKLDDAPFDWLVDQRVADFTDWQGWKFNDACDEFVRQLLKWPARKKD